jgi:hypothetical protein
MTGKTLTERAVDGVAWQFIAVGGNFFLRGLILILLTRSLEASQFGIIAAATVILTIAERIGLIGVDRVLVQRLDLTDRYVSSAFAISLWSGCLLAILIYMGADLLAAWMNMPELAPFVRFLSVSLVLGSLAQVPAALLQRGLRFKALSIADIGSYLLGFGAVALRNLVTSNRRNGPVRFADNDALRACEAGTGIAAATSGHRQSGATWCGVLGWIDRQLSGDEYRQHHRRPDPRSGCAGLL